MNPIFTMLVVMICLVSSVKATTIQPTSTHLTSVQPSTEPPLKISQKATIKFSDNDRLENYQVKSLLFSNDGHYLTVANYKVKEIEENSYLITGKKYSVFNIEEPEKPVLSGSFAPERFQRFDKNKQYSRDDQLLISVDFDGQLRIENSTRPEALQLIATLQPPQIAPSSFAIGNSRRFLVVGDVRGGFYIYDLKEVGKPELISSTDTEMPINYIILSEDEKMSVILGETAQFKIYNITDIKAPSLVAHEVFSNSTQMFSNGFLLGEGFKFLALQAYSHYQENERVLLTYSVESPAAPQLIYNSYENASLIVPTFDYKPDNNLLVALASEPGFTNSPFIIIFNVTDPTSPEELGILVTYNHDSRFINVAFNPGKNILAVSERESEQVVLYQYGEDEHEHSSSHCISEKLHYPLIMFTTLAALLFP